MSDKCHYIENYIKIGFLYYPYLIKGFFIIYANKTVEFVRSVKADSARCGGLFVGHPHTLLRQRVQDSFCGRQRRRQHTLLRAHRLGALYPLFERVQVVGAAARPRLHAKTWPRRHQERDLPILQVARHWRNLRANLHDCAAKVRGLPGGHLSGHAQRYTVTILRRVDTRREP